MLSEDNIMKLKTVKEAKHLFGQRVLLRVDFNVPVKNGVVVDNFKIQKSLPTIKFLLNAGAKLVIVSHLGRPVKKDKKFSLLPVAKELERILGVKVNFSEINKRDEFEGEKLVMLENIRFYKGEEKNDIKFSKQLADLADIFVLDGFAVAHRDAASVSGVAKILPSYAGLLLEKEVGGLWKVLDKPKHPFVVVLGGVKMETKIPVLKNLLSKADKILLGGGISSTYLWSLGGRVGGSLVDKEYAEQLKKYIKNRKAVLPVDVVVGDSKGKKIKVVDFDKKINLSNKEGIYDIGPKTVGIFADYLKSARTIVWNGALGFFEQPPYHHGTFAVVRYMGSLSKGRAFGVSGGGETVEILKKLDLLEDFDLVSTGGGAMLEFLSGKKLPGLKKFIK